MKGIRNSDLSCTFCGPGTWATWEVVTDEAVVFACDRHHVELSEANLIRLERIRGKEIWIEISEPRKILDEQNLTELDGQKECE